MSEKSVILHDEITSSQADAVSVVGSARTRLPFLSTSICPWRKFLVDMDKESPGIWVKLWNSLLLEIMAKLMKVRGRRHTSRVRVSMLFLVLPRWRSAGLSCSVSFSQKFSGKKTGGTDFVWACFWHHSTSAMWIFKSSYLISFWFARIIWRLLIISIS